MNKNPYTFVCVDCGLVQDELPFPERCRPLPCERVDIKYGPDGRVLEVRAIPYLKGPRKP